jgi:hypothetical protein
MLPIESEPQNLPQVGAGGVISSILGFDLKSALGSLRKMVENIRWPR